MMFQIYADEKGQHIYKIVDGFRWCIPADPANTSYQEYLAWLAEGNTPEPWEAPNGA